MGRGGTKLRGFGACEDSLGHVYVDQQYEPGGKVGEAYTVYRSTVVIVAFSLHKLIPCEVLPKACTGGSFVLPCQTELHT